MNLRPLRPKLEDCGSAAEFRLWYYLKSELVDFVKKSGLPVRGSKSDLGDQVAAFLDGRRAPEFKKRKSSSRFDWANEKLTLATEITDNVSFGPNVRNFLKSQIGPAFTCNSDFMDWMKGASGATLEDAVEVWKALDARKMDPEFQTRIRSYNQYNQFTRDILAANPSINLDVVRRIWKAKRTLPLPMTYSKADLDLICDC